MEKITTQAIEEFKQSLSPSAVIALPGSPKYDEGIKRWAANAEKPAGLIVFPTSPQDISASILFSRAHSLDLAICGGGHGTSGAASTTNGLLISLSSMRSVSVSPASKTVTCQGGALWSDIDSALHPYGLAAVGGTVNHTGVGGLTLGGGYGFLTPKYGLVIDNLLSVEMVLASGEIVRCSEEDNKDLFWAVRGAGSCFGVASEFTFRCYEQKEEVWSGLLAYPSSALEQLVEFSNHVLDDPNGKSLLLLGFAAPPPAHNALIVIVVFYNGPEAEAKEYFSPILELNPLQNNTKMMPYSQVNAQMNEMMFHGVRRNMKGSSFLKPLSSSFAAEIFADYEAFIERVPDTSMTVVLWEFVPYRKIMEVGQRETAFSNRGHNGNLLFGPGWTDPVNDGVCREWARMMGKKTKEVFERSVSELPEEAREINGVGEYGNYDGLGSTAQAAFGVNFERLAELKKKYDPENVFAKGPSFTV